MTRKKRFDPTLKRIYERYAQDWLAFLLPRFGLPQAPSAEVIDSDVSTVSVAADKVIRVGGPDPWIFHLELLASHMAKLARKLLLYNVLISAETDLPVRSAVLLLRPEADRRSIDGRLVLKGPDDQAYLDFRYGVLRLWQLPTEPLLQAGLGVLPLAPMSAVPMKELPEVIEQMQRRLDAESTPAQTADLWVATSIIMGLVHDQEFIQHLLRGVRNMRESSTYQAILHEGKAVGEAEGQLKEARRILIDFGEETLGRPGNEIRKAIASIADVSRLEQLIKRVPHVASWQDLLTDNGAPRKPGRRKNGSS